MSSSPEDIDEQEQIFNSVNYPDSVVVNIIPDDQRKTSNYITHSEATEAIGIRSAEIENGSPVFVEINGITDPNIIAEKEFFSRKSPLILEREIYRSGDQVWVEHWPVRIMTYAKINKFNSDHL